METPGQLVEEDQTAQNGAGAVADVAVVLDDGEFAVLAVEDVIDVPGDAVVAHADGEEVDAGVAGAVGVASEPVVGLGAGAEVDIAAQREEDRFGFES